jgi:hypothetical protein
VWPPGGDRQPVGWAVPDQRGHVGAVSAASTTDRLVDGEVPRAAGPLEAVVAGFERAN